MGPSTQLKNTHAVAVDPVHDEIYVPGRHGDNRILVFPREADGDVAPMRILELDKTPGRVAVDPVRNLLVVSGGPQLHIYDRTASGRAQPRGVISVPQDVGRRGTGPDGNQFRERNDLRQDQRWRPTRRPSITWVSGVSMTTVKCLPFYHRRSQWGAEGTGGGWRLI